jgi:hypothetical protein
MFNISVHAKPVLSLPAYRAYSQRLKLKTLYNETPVTLDIKLGSERAKEDVEEELENVKTSYRLKSLECRKRMNNVVG